MTDSSSRDLAERLPGLAEQILHLVDRWSWDSAMCRPGPAQRTAAAAAVGLLDQLLNRAALARYVLTEEISAAETPDVLAGAEG